MKICRKCKKTGEFYKNQDWCKKCQSEYHKKQYQKKKTEYRQKQNEYRKTEAFRENHKKHRREYYKRNRHKAIARAKLAYEVRMGRIKRGKCWCGETKVEAHHEDYNKPLEVMWLCRKHHREHDRKKMESTIKK